MLFNTTHSVLIKTLMWYKKIPTVLFWEQLWSHTLVPTPASSTTSAQRSCSRMERLIDRSWVSSSSPMRRRGGCWTPSPIQRSIKRCSKRSCSTFSEVREAQSFARLSEARKREDDLLKASKGCFAVKYWNFSCFSQSFENCSLRANWGNVLAYLQHFIS